MLYPTWTAEEKEERRREPQRSMHPHKRAPKLMDTDGDAEPVRCLLCEHRFRFRFAARRVWRDEVVCPNCHYDAVVVYDSGDI